MTPSPATGSTPPGNSSTSASMAHKASSSPSPSRPAPARRHPPPAIPASTRASLTSSSWKPPTAEMPSASSSTSCRATWRTSNRTTASQPQKKLLRRGFDNTPGHNGERRRTNSVPRRHRSTTTNTPGSDSCANSVDGKALRHSYGSKEAVTVANRAVVRSPVRTNRVRRHPHSRLRKLHPD